MSKVSIYITDTSTGVERVVAEGVVWAEADEKEEGGITITSEDFLWSEGNYACDCNRSDFFHRAAKEHDPGSPCDGERFRLRAVNEEGDVVYSDH